MATNTFRKGFYPADSQRAEYRLYPISSSNGTAVFVGDVVSAITGGSVAPAAAADGTILLGTVVELFDAQSSVPGQNAPVPIGMWSSTVSSKYLPASTAGYALIAVAKPGMKFVCQTNTIMTAAAINKSTALYAGAGNTTTAQSGHAINGNDLNTGSDFIIIGPYNQLGSTDVNDITTAGAAWLVEFNKSLNFGTGKSTGV